MTTLRPRLSGTPVSNANSCSVCQVSSASGKLRPVLYRKRRPEPISQEKHEYLTGLFCVWCGGGWHALCVACGRCNYNDNDVDNDGKDDVEDDDD